MRFEADIPPDMADLLGKLQTSTIS
jgi:hypothetical protein